MDRSLKNQLLSNLACILCFSLVFSLYCHLTCLLFNSTKIICENKQASSGLSENLIVIDAGHGGEDGGTIGTNGVLEKDLNLDMSEALGEYLRFAGFEVVQTRTEDILLYDRNVNYKGRKKMLDLAARLKIAEEVLPDLFISLHMNAFPDHRYSGLTVYYSPNNERSHEAGTLIRKDVIAHLQPDNTRELKKAGSNIYLLDRLNCPSVLIECGFLSNEAECENLSEEGYRHKLSLVIFSSLSSFFQE